MKRKGLLYGIIEKRRAAFAIIFILFLLGGVCYRIIPKQQFPII